MGTKRSKTPISKICQICNNTFDAWYVTTRTCSKQCKNVLAREISKKQFSTDESRTKHSSLMKELMATDDIREKFEKGMLSRRSYKKENHPRWGVVLDEDTKRKIGVGNKGKFKGMTWEKMYGKEMADLRRIENAEKMALTNSKLLNNRTSKKEKKLLEVYGPLGFKQNRQIGKYTVDFVKEETKEIVEYYGDYWHCNPKIYPATYFNRSIGMSAAEKWKYDEERKKYLQDRGYSVTVIWESEIK